VISLLKTLTSNINATLVGLPAYQIDRLQSVLNAAAQLVYSSRRYDHVTPLLRELHWLRMSQRIDYKLAVLVYCCLNGLAPSYLASDLQSVADLDARRRLRSASTSTLVVPVMCLSTVGDREFPVAVARVWNSLPADVTSSPSLPTFQTDEDRTVCLELVIAPAASDTLLFTVRAARTSFRFCLFFFCKVS